MIKQYVFVFQQKFMNSQLSLNSVKACNFQCLLQVNNSTYNEKYILKIQTIKLKLKMTLNELLQSEIMFVQMPVHLCLWYRCPNMPNVLFSNHSQCQQNCSLSRPPHSPAVHLHQSPAANSCPRHRNTARRPSNRCCHLPFTPLTTVYFSSCKKQVLQIAQGSYFHDIFYITITINHIVIFCLKFQKKKNSFIKQPCGNASLDNQ